MRTYGKSKFFSWTELVGRILNSSSMFLYVTGYTNDSNHMHHEKEHAQKKIAHITQLCQPEGNYPSYAPSNRSVSLGPHTWKPLNN